MNAPLRSKWLSRMRAHLGKEGGGSTIEFAMSTVLLCTVMFGILELSLMLYTYHSVSQIAREGARYAMVHGATCSVSGASCTASATDVQNAILAIGYPGIVSANLTPSVTYSGFPSGTTCTPSASCNNPGNLVTVKVTYAFPLNIPFVPANTLTLSSTSAMVISQ